MSVEMTTKVEVKEYTEYPKLRGAVTARLLKRIVELDAILKAAKEERDSIKGTLADRMERADVKVCLVGGVPVTRVDGRPGNLTLVRNKLLKFIDPDDLKKCMKRGKPVDATIRVGAEREKAED